MFRYTYFGIVVGYQVLICTNIILIQYMYLFNIDTVYVLTQY
jgi:hypothetical protein